jgi:flagellar hook-associated protein 3 FlgL
MTNTILPSDGLFLRAMDKIQARMDRAQREVSSGKRIFSASDEPDSIGGLLSVRAEKQLNEQMQSNLGRTKAEVDAAETGLQQAVKILERARVIAGQGQSEFNEESTFRALQAEAEDLTKQLLNVSNIAIEGRFIFSGDQDSVQPFTFDTETGLVSAYAGSSATRQSLFPGGSPFDVARAGGDIFDSSVPGRSAFATLNQLQEAFAARDTGALREALVSIESAFGHVSGELSFYGAVQRRVGDATAAADAGDLRLQAQLSRLEDADLAESILNMQQAQFQQQSALQVRGQLPRTSLFDYLG